MTFAPAQGGESPTGDAGPSAARRLASRIGMYGLAAVVASAGLLWAFLAIADETTEQSRLVRVDHMVGAWLEAHGTEWGERIFLTVTQLGAPVLAASIVAAVLWFATHQRRRDAAALAIVSGGGMLLGSGLKLLFHRGRPETATEFITRQSWSFPSGHALNSIIGYGFLAMLVLQRVSGRWRRAGVIVAAALLIGLIGFSRLYLGVHYLSDVVGGFMAGAVWLMVSIAAYRGVTRGEDSRTVRR